jgi:hypothetical protein
MPSYRLYHLSANDHITSAQVVVADDDKSAEAQAELICARTHRPVEIWQGSRMLGTFTEHTNIEPLPSNF